MPYPTKDEFAKLLFTRKHSEVLAEHVFGGIPFAYRDNPSDYGVLANHLAGALQISGNDVMVVGSGKIGFGLNPDRFGTPFHDGSDIDVLIVSSALFDTLWLDMLRVSRRQFAVLDRRDQNAIRNIRTNDVYWGRLWPEMLLRVSSVAKQWVAAFRGVGQYPRLAGREINGRLYRTHDHAEVYHLDGMQQLMIRLKVR